VTSINDLKQDHKNARKRTNQSAELIQESIKRYGAARSIVIDEDNRILAGNGTIEGAKQAGIKNVRVIETDGSEIIAVKRTGLTEHEKVGLALADNRTSDLSDWDAEMLHQLSQEHDVSPWFDEEDLAEIIGEIEKLPSEEHTDPDDVPEVDEEAVITKPGDLWILGDHRLLCGDSTNIQHVERLMDGKKADMVFTDPPYGVSIGQQTQGSSNLAKKNNYGSCDWDKEIPYDAISDSLTLAPICILWGANYYAEKLPPSPCWIVWDKENTGDFADAELAWTNQNTAVRIFKHMWNGMIKASERGQKRVHPTQKPVALAEWCFENYGNPATVLDLFLGSGSTLIACEQTRRSCYGMELDPAYCDVIVKRWSDFTGREAILAPQEE
jgi:DNA modification methylase